MDTRILFPPRPKGKINPLAELPGLEKSGKWIAQPKFNGTRTLTYIGSDSEIILFDRFGKRNNYQLSFQQRDELLSSLAIEKGCIYWLDGELLHYKTKEIKDTLVFFDILWQDKFLYGCNQLIRLQKLSSLCKTPDNLDLEGRTLYISPTFRLSQVFNENFVERYKEAIPWKWCEGLVLRDTTSVLNTPCTKIDEQVLWQKRCRKSSKSYSH